MEALQEIPIVHGRTKQSSSREQGMKQRMSCWGCEEELKPKRSSAQGWPSALQLSTSPPRAACHIRTCNFLPDVAARATQLTIPLETPLTCPTTSDGPPPISKQMVDRFAPRRIRLRPSISWTRVGLLDSASIKKVCGVRILFSLKYCTKPAPSLALYANLPRTQVCKLRSRFGSLAP